MVVSEDLLKNGLELEAVSLTGLDQTSFEYFNPQNVFDAEGLTKLTESIESRRKLRNDIEQDTEVEIRRKNLSSEQEKLTIGREEEYARLAQEREISVRKAAQAAEIALEQSDKQRQAEEAKIVAEREVELARIQSSRTLEEGSIAKEQFIKQKEIEKERAITTTDIEREKSIELSRQDRDIAVAEKSKAQSEAKAEADKARAEAVKAEEQVETARVSEIANREKEITLILAQQEAEQAAIGVTVAAEAEKQAAEDKAEALRTEAEAEADQQRLMARGAADAEVMKADAAERRYSVDAAGKLALNEAQNQLSAEQIAMQVRLALLEQLPAIIRESVKPMEQIDGIKIIQVDGLTGGGNHGGTSEGEASGNLADQVVGSALRYRAQAPMLDSLLQEIGMQGGDITELSNLLHHKPTPTNDPDLA